MAGWWTRGDRTRRTRQAALAGAAVAAFVTLPLASTTVLAAPPSPPFTQCPAIGLDTSCETLIVVNADGTVTIVSDPGQGPYEGGEDTLIGVQNNESVPLQLLHLSSATLAIFGFEGDGICAFAPFTGSGYCASLPSGSSGYEGPDTTFSGIAGNKRSGVVNFTDSGGGLAAGASTFFSLEQNVRAANLSATAPPLVTFTNSSPASADFNDPTTVSATLTANGAPVAGETVTFTLGSGSGAPTCDGTTNGSGVASCSLTPNQVAGSYQIHASFAGNGSLDASSGSEAFTVTHEEDALAFTGATSGTVGKPVTLSAVLTTDDPAAATALAGKTVTLSVGTGSNAQSCSGTTDASGVASCTIASLAQPTGSAAVSASFAGDTHYRVGTATATMQVAGVTVPAVGGASWPLPLLLGGFLLLIAGRACLTLSRMQRRRLARRGARRS